MVEKGQDNPFDEAAKKSTGSGKATAEKIPKQAERDQQGDTVEASEPTLTFSGLKQKRIYCRHTTASELEELYIRVQQALTEEYGVTNANQSEITAAVAEELLKTVEAEDVADELIKQRGFEDEVEE